MFMLSYLFLGAETVKEATDNHQEDASFVSVLTYNIHSLFAFL